MSESTLSQLSWVSNDPVLNAPVTKRFNDIFTEVSANPSYLHADELDPAQKRTFRALLAGATLLGDLSTNQSLVKELKSGLPRRHEEHQQDVEDVTREVHRLVNGQSQTRKSGSRKVQSKAVFTELKKLLRCRQSQWTLRRRRYRQPKKAVAPMVRRAPPPDPS